MKVEFATVTAEEMTNNPPPRRLAVELVILTFSNVVMPRAPCTLIEPPFASVEQLLKVESIIFAPAPLKSKQPPPSPESIAFRKTESTNAVSLCNSLVELIIT